MIDTFVMVNSKIGNLVDKKLNQVFLKFAKIMNCFFFFCSYQHGISRHAHPRIFIKQKPNNVKAQVRSFPKFSNRFNIYIYLYWISFIPHKHLYTPHSLILSRHKFVRRFLSHLWILIQFYIKISTHISPKYAICNKIIS